jgi:hypothetical protein
MFPGHSVKKSFYLNRKEWSMVHCHPSYDGKYKIGGPVYRPRWAKSDPKFKINRTKTVGHMVEEVQCLPIMHEVLSSIPL